jgi:hypothetical protein
VAVSTNGFVSNSSTFTIAPASVTPTISSLSPSSAQAWERDFHLDGEWLRIRPQFDDFVEWDAAIDHLHKRQPVDRDRRIEPYRHAREM